jgi:dihydroneopterin aldolase
MYEQTAHNALQTDLILSIRLWVDARDKTASTDNADKLHYNEYSLATFRDIISMQDIACRSHVPTTQVLQ